MCGEKPVLKAFMLFEGNKPARLLDTVGSSIASSQTLEQTAAYIIFGGEAVDTDKTLPSTSFVIG